MTLHLSWPDFIGRLRWLDGSPLADHIEPYRMRLFEAFDERDEHGRLKYTLALDGRAKKNAKSLDEMLHGLKVLVEDPEPGYDCDIYQLANDADQARDNLDLTKKLVRANPVLEEWLIIKRDEIARRDGRGFLKILPAGDVIGQHGKSYRLCLYDEIHGYKNWDIFEAMQPDPNRRDCQVWICSYASIHHRRGTPLFDLFSIGRAGADRRMLFSWYAADFTTDPDFEDKSPEERANPSMGSWSDADYLEQQKRRLPAHKFRRLHLNLPGLPEGSAYQPEPIMEAIERGVSSRPPEAGLVYHGFVDMSGGSRDDAVLCVSHRDPDGRAVVDLIQDQGRRPPFDPSAAVDRFARTLRQYRCSEVCGDRYAGETFRARFEERRIKYIVSDRTAHQLYEDLEPTLNSHSVVLLDVPTLEQQLMGLIWRGSRIDHPSGEHDDHANATAGAIRLALEPKRKVQRATWGRSRPELSSEMSGRMRVDMR